MLLAVETGEVVCTGSSNRSTAADEPAHSSCWNSGSGCLDCYLFCMLTVLFIYVAQ
jgi:hypothetical protein